MNECLGSSRTFRLENAPPRLCTSKAFLTRAAAKPGKSTLKCRIIHACYAIWTPPPQCVRCCMWHLTNSNYIGATRKCGPPRKPKHVICMQRRIDYTTRRTFSPNQRGCNWLWRVLDVCQPVCLFSVLLLSMASSLFNQGKFNSTRNEGFFGPNAYIFGTSETIHVGEKPVIVFI
jgi:hypothetical protein